MQNIVGDKIKLGIIKLHSVVDLITNSSTELFCVVEGNDTDAIYDLLDEILEQFGCIACKDGLSVEQHVKYNDDTGEEDEIEGQLAIYCEYHQAPCKLIKDKIKELLTVVEEPEE